MDRNYDEETEVYATIRAMQRAELGAVILGAGYALPDDKTRGSLREAVRLLYLNETVTADEIYAEYHGS